MVFVISMAMACSYLMRDHRRLEVFGTNSVLWLQLLRRQRFQVLTTTVVDPLFAAEWQEGRFKTLVGPLKSWLHSAIKTLYNRFPRAVSTTLVHHLNSPVSGSIEKQHCRNEKGRSGHIITQERHTKNKVASVKNRLSKSHSYSASMFLWRHELMTPEVYHLS